MAQPANSSDAAATRCSWFAQVCFVLMIVYGGALFLHPKIGPPAQVHAKEFGWRSPVLILLWSSAFAAFFSYIVWCLGLVPFSTDRLRRSVCRRIGLYVGAVAIAGWSSAVLTWSVGLIKARHFGFGTS